MEALSKENRFYFMGIAILAVILHHLDLGCNNYWNEGSLILHFFKYGNIGVDVFLFLSAYGCCASWEHNSWKQYAINRARRIYPSYIIYLIAALVFFYPALGVEDKLESAALSLTGLSIFTCFDVRIDWYTPSIIMMYMFIPLLLFIKSLINNKLYCKKRG